MIGRVALTVEQLTCNQMVEGSNPSVASKIMSLAIYTAVFNGYDRVRNPEVVCDCDYHLFTDDPGAPDVWKPVRASQIDEDPRRSARRYKVLSHILLIQYEKSLWIDGEVALLGDTLEWVEECLDGHDMAVKIHDERDCAYKEAEFCVAHRFDHPELIAKQVARYRAEGYPADNGLAWTNVLMRRHNDRVKAFNEEWMREILAGSRRDQIAFDRCAWKTGVKVNRLHPMDAEKFAPARGHVKSERVI